MNRSERFVHDLARDAFLSLWTYPNPIGKDRSKELCDVLVVCRPDILIFSVKEIELKTEGDAATQRARWKRRAVEDSAKQIQGAERRLLLTDSVVAADGSKGVELGEPSERVIHRIAVAIGSDGSIPLESRDYGSGFVHVFDEQTLFFLLRELNTITDVVEYLTARQRLLSEDLGGMLIGTEQDLIAAYFVGVHSFDALVDGEYDLRVIAGSWDDFIQLPEYQAKNAADKISLAWDQLIEKVHQLYVDGEMEHGGDLASIDAVTRIMAREPRLQRRILGRSFVEFLSDPTKKARIAFGDSGVGYVFLKQSHSVPRERRVKELEARCILTRDRMETDRRPGLVVGLATELPEPGSGFSLDLCLFDAAEWDDQQRIFAAEVRKRFGFFEGATESRFSGDEFPAEG